MSNSKLISGIILGAATTLALYRWYSMTEDEKEEFLNHIKQTTHELLDDADKTVEKIEQYITGFKEKEDANWIDRAHMMKRIYHDFYGKSGSSKALNYNK